MTVRKKEISLLCGQGAKDVVASKVELLNIDFQNGIGDWLLKNVTFITFLAN